MPADSDQTALCRRHCRARKRCARRRRRHSRHHHLCPEQSRRVGASRQGPGPSIRWRTAIRMTPRGSCRRSPRPLIRRPQVRHALQGLLRRRQVQTAQGVNPMQPYYFPFVRSKGDLLEGFRLPAAQRAGSDRRGDLLDRGKSGFSEGRRRGKLVLPGGSDRSGQQQVIVDGLATPYGSGLQRRRQRPRPLLLS